MLLKMETISRVLLVLGLKIHSNTLSIGARIFEIGNFAIIKMPKMKI